MDYAVTQTEKIHDSNTAMKNLQIENETRYVEDKPRYVEDKPRNSKFSRLQKEKRQDMVDLCF